MVLGEDMPFCRLLAEPENNGEGPAQQEAEEEEKPAMDKEQTENGKPVGTEGVEAEQEEEDDQEYEVVDDAEAATKGTVVGIIWSAQ